MKIIYFVIILSLTTFVVKGQLVHCRPKVCLVEYKYHDDRTSNAEMTAIKGALPDILIDNTPGGYWGQINKGVGCIPLNYTPLGIQVFSYITGGREGTEYNSTEDDSTSNLARIDAIAKDGATGVFLDEVNTYPNAAGKHYISLMYNECQAKGLKLILNPGTYNFDSWLMSHCDYIMTDEQYNGTRTPSSSEIPYLDRILVASLGVTNATDGAAISLGARANGFGFTYACDSYNAIPTWINAYLTNITTPPATPTITLHGRILQSDAPQGNQWFEKTSGIIIGADSQSHIATAAGSYYVIVTLQGCKSSASNNSAYTYPLPVAKIVSDTFVFYNTARILDASSSSGGTLPYSYSWSSFPAGFSSTLQKPSTGNLTTSTRFYLTLYDSLGYTDTTSVFIKVDPQITAVAKSGLPFLCHNAETYLDGTSSAGGMGFLSYTWTSDPPGFFSTLAKPSTGKLSSSTRYYLKVTDSFGYSDSTSIYISVDPQIHSEIMTDTVLCYNTSTILDASRSNGGTAPYMYTWTSSQSGFSGTAPKMPTGTLTVSASYYLSIQDSKGCVDSSKVFIRVNPKVKTPKLSLNNSTLEADIPTGNQWYEITSGIIAGAVSQDYTPTVSGHYYDIVTVQGCKSDTSNIFSFTASNTGILNIESLNDISFYPNPTSETLCINLSRAINEDFNLHLYNALGILVKSQKLSEDNRQLDIREFENGVYIVVINSKEGIISQKIIIRR